MNKLRDYFLVPTTEEVELEEKSEYGPDIRGEISQLQKMLKGLPQMHKDGLRLHKVIRQKVRRTKKMKKSLMKQKQLYPDLVETD